MSPPLGTVHYKLFVSGLDPDEIRIRRDRVLERQMQYWALPSGVTPEKAVEYWQSIDHSGRGTTNPSSGKTPTFKPVDGRLEALRELARQGRTEFERETAESAGQMKIVWGEPDLIEEPLGMAPVAEVANEVGAGYVDEVLPEAAEEMAAVTDELEARYATALTAEAETTIEAFSSESMTPRTDNEVEPGSATHISDAELYSIISQDTAGLSPSNAELPTAESTANTDGTLELTSRKTNAELIAESLSAQIAANASSLSALAQKPILSNFSRILEMQKQANMEKQAEQHDQQLQETQHDVRQEDSQDSQQDGKPENKS